MKLAMSTMLLETTPCCANFWGGSDTHAAANVPV